jgi:hypothetical protein
VEGKAIPARFEIAFRRRLYRHRVMIFCRRAVWSELPGGGRRAFTALLHAGCWSIRKVCMKRVAAGRGLQTRQSS